MSDSGRHTTIHYERLRFMKPQAAATTHMSCFDSFDGYSYEYIYHITGQTIEPHTRTYLICPAKVSFHKPNKRH